MIERRRLRGDTTRASRFIQIGRKMLAQVRQPRVPTRKTFSDGTRITVQILGSVGEITIYSPPQQETLLFLMSYYSAPVRSFFGPEVFVYSVSGALKRRIDITYHITAVSEIFRSIAVQGNYIYITNAIDSTFLTYTKKGDFLQSVDLGYFPIAVDANSEYIVVHGTVNLCHWLYIYNTEQVLIAAHNLKDQGRTIITKSENLKIYDGRVYFFTIKLADPDSAYVNVKDSLEFTVYDLSTQTFDSKPFLWTKYNNYAFDIFEGKLYVIFMDQEGVIFVYLIEESGYTFEKTIGVFGPEAVDRNPIDGLLEFPPMEPYEFYNNYLYIPYAIAVNEMGVYVSESSNDIVDYPSVDRIMHFTLDGEFISSFGRQDYYRRSTTGKDVFRQVRSMDIG